MAFFPDTRIPVLPIVFYPKGVSHSQKWSKLWLDMHLAARAFFRRLLKGRDTFALADQLLVVDGALTAQEYRAQCWQHGHLGDTCLAHDGVETILVELLTRPQFSGFTRYTLPYILSALMVDPTQAWGEGGGRCLNGWTNRGGGLMVIPTWQFDQGKLMSTLVHELGHTFGLTHVWLRPDAVELPPGSKLFQCYYGEKTSRSIMSYNDANHTNSTDPDTIPGCLLGDEIQALSWNKLVFPDLTFDSATDYNCPPKLANCPPHDGVSRHLWLGPMETFWCFTASGSTEGTHVENLNDRPQRHIIANQASPSWEPVRDRVWRSGPLNAQGWVAVDVTFPVPVTLDRIIFYSQHSGKFDRADRIRVQWQTAGGLFVLAKQVNTATDDTVVDFNAQTAQMWRLSFSSSQSQHVVMRGLRFFHGTQEVFPPAKPHARTTFGETFGSRVANLTATQRLIRADSSQVGFDPATMWHSGQANEAGWVSIEIAFPAPQHLDHLVVYSAHSGGLHQVTQVQIAALNANGKFDVIQQTPVFKDIIPIPFSRREAQVWRLAFQAGPSGMVVIRGLRFFDQKFEEFPPSAFA